MKLRLPNALKVALMAATSGLVFTTFTTGSTAFAGWNDDNTVYTFTGTDDEDWDTVVTTSTVTQIIINEGVNVTGTSLVANDTVPALTNVTINGTLELTGSGDALNLRTRNFTITGTGTLTVDNNAVFYDGSGSGYTQEISVANTIISGTPRTDAFALTTLFKNNVTLSKGYNINFWAYPSYLKFEDAAISLGGSIAKGSCGSTPDVTFSGTNTIDVTNLASTVIAGSAARAEGETGNGFSSTVDYNYQVFSGVNVVLADNDSTLTVKKGTETLKANTQTAGGYVLTTANSGTYIVQTAGETTSESVATDIGTTAYDYVQVNSGSTLAMTTTDIPLVKVTGSGAVNVGLDMTVSYQTSTLATGALTVTGVALQLGDAGKDGQTASIASFSSVTLSDASLNNWAAASDINSLTIADGTTNYIRSVDMNTGTVNFTGTTSLDGDLTMASYWNSQFKFAKLTGDGTLTMRALASNSFTAGLSDGVGQGAHTVTISDISDFTGAIVLQDSAAQLTLEGDLTKTPNITVTNGTFIYSGNSISSGVTLPNVTFSNSGTVNISGTVSLANLTMSSSTGSVVLDADDDNLTISGAISGGSVTKDKGTLNYGGKQLTGTSLTGATLTSNARTAVSGNVTLTNIVNSKTGTDSYALVNGSNGSSSDVTANLTLAGTIDLTNNGTSSIANVGFGSKGTLTIADNAVVTIGRFWNSSTAASNGSIVVGDGASLTLSSTNSSTVTNLTNNGTLNLGGSALTIVNTLKGKAINAGENAVTFTDGMAIYIDDSSTAVGGASGYDDSTTGRQTAGTRTYTLVNGTGDVTSSGTVSIYFNDTLNESAALSDDNKSVTVADDRTRYNIAEGESAWYSTANGTDDSLTAPTTINVLGTLNYGSSSGKKNGLTDSTITGNGIVNMYLSATWANVVSMAAFEGTTVINSGYFTLNGEGAAYGNCLTLADGVNIQLSSGSTYTSETALVLNGTTQVHQNGSANLTFSGTVTGTGTYDRRGGGTLNFNNTVKLGGFTQTTASTTNFNAATTLTTLTAATNAGSVIDFNAGTADAPSTITTFALNTNATLGGAGVVKVTGALNGSVATLTKTDAGTLTVEGAAALAGLTISGGSIGFSGATSTLTGDVNMSAGTLSLLGAAATGTAIHTTGATTVNIGSDSANNTTTLTRIELGDSSGDSVTTLNVANGSTLKITGTDNTNAGYKYASVILGEWVGSATANINGTLLASGAKLLTGDQGYTLNIASTGTVAALGIGVGNTGTLSGKNEKITVNLNGAGAKLVLGGTGFLAEQTKDGQKPTLASTGGTIATYADSMTVAPAVTLTSGTTTIDSTKYTIGTDDNSVTAGTDGSTITVSGAISGDGNLETSGVGTVVLSAANAYTGGTAVTAGTLKLSGSGTIGTGAASVASGATLELAQTANATVANAISGDGTVTRTGSNTVTLTGDISAKALSITSGTLAFGSSENSTNTLTATSVTADGSSSVFYVSHKAGTFDSTDIYLKNGGQMYVFDSTDAEMTWKSLNVAGAATLGYGWNSQQTFTTLTGGTAGAELTATKLTITMDGSKVESTKRIFKVGTLQNFNGTIDCSFSSCASSVGPREAIIGTIDQASDYTVQLIGTGAPTITGLAEKKGEGKVIVSTDLTSADSFSLSGGQMSVTAGTTTLKTTTLAGNTSATAPTNYISVSDNGTLKVDNFAITAAENQTAKVYNSTDTAEQIHLTGYQQQNHTLVQDATMTTTTDSVNIQADMENVKLVHEGTGAVQIYGKANLHDIQMTDSSSTLRLRNSSSKVFSGTNSLAGQFEISDYDYNYSTAVIAGSMQVGGTVTVTGGGTYGQGSSAEIHLAASESANPVVEIERNPATTKDTTTAATITGGVTMSYTAATATTAAQASILGDSEGKDTVVDNTLISLTEGAILNLADVTIAATSAIAADKATIAFSGTNVIAQASAGEQTINNVTFNGGSVTMGTAKDATSGTYNHDGTLTATNVTVSADSTLNANLSVSGAMTFGGALEMGCSVKFTGATTISLSDSMASTVTSAGKVAVLTSVDSYSGLENATYNGQALQAIQDAGASTYTLYATPEPATTTLSLLALAGLAARRRRH